MHLVRGGQIVEDALTHLIRDFGIAIQQRRRELISTQARHAINIAHQLLQAIGCLAQQFIADIATEGVVDGLENRRDR